MSQKLELIVTTPERELFRASADSVTLPTIDGQITVLPHHLPLVSVLKPGELVVRQGERVTPYVIGGGFIEVQPHKLIVLADTAETVEEIDEERAEQARLKAKELMKSKRQDAEEYANLAAKLERDLARLRVAKKYRHRGHHQITHEAVRHE